MSVAAARRISITGEVSARSLRDGVCSRARQLGLLGWVRLMEDGSLCVHAEGGSPALEAFASWLRSVGDFDEVSECPVRVEGHEQFAIRGVAAGTFVIEEHRASTHHFDLRLETGGVMRSWAVPKGPSMDPAVKRLALEVGDHPVRRVGGGGARDAIAWDRGCYEQGGRVPWPEALDRGHAVFVLHGRRLRGGFALQRTRGGAKAQWLLIKRRDEYARPGSNVLAENPIGHRRAQVARTARRPRRIAADRRR